VVKRTADAGNFSHGGQQFGESLSTTRIPFRVLIRVHVLAEQLNFRVAEIGHLAGFGEHGLRRPAALFPAGVGDNAIRTELVAAFDNGDVAAMRIGAGGELGLKALVGLAVVEPGDAN
jgi:hypothetical protein